MEPPIYRLRAVLIGGVTRRDRGLMQRLCTEVCRWAIETAVGICHWCAPLAFGAESSPKMINMLESDMPGVDHIGM